jgi:hypothetical protein
MLIPTRVHAGATHSASTTAAASAPTLGRASAPMERAAATHTPCLSEFQCWRFWLVLADAAEME